MRCVEQLLRSPRQGQEAGRCSLIRRAEVAILAGTVISCRRMVAPVALAWRVGSWRGEVSWR